MRQASSLSNGVGPTPRSHTQASLIAWVVTQGASGHWIAVCDPMNLALEANSLDELYSVINEGVHFLFQDLVKNNELDEYLRERGWQASGMPWQMVIMAPDNITIP
jgi:hypothetical protein